MIFARGLSLACCLLWTVKGIALPVEVAQNPFRPTQLAPPGLLDITIDEVTSLFEAGSLTSVELVTAYLDRIAEVNHILRAVSEVNPDALSIAKALDHERASGHVRGPLHGIPILLKDNIATGDEMNNTAGSLCLLGYRSARDSAVAARLRAAGAVLIGKTSMSEWAAYRSSGNTTSMGWSGYGGQVLGAYHEDQDPFGSSSGSGVAVSIGLAMSALGTEVPIGNAALAILVLSLTEAIHQTSGSIIGPSSQNNVVGIKPTLGLTSRDLVIPITIRQDTVGPIARTVKDAAIILSAIAGRDPKDNYTCVQPFDKTPDYTKSLNYSAFQGSRIGVPRNGLFKQSTNDLALMAAFESAIETMRSAGAEIIDNANFPAFEESVEASINSIRANYNFKVIGTDFIAGITSYISKVSSPDGDQFHTFKELLDCTQSDPREEYPDRDTSRWEQALSYNCTHDSQEVWNAYQLDLYYGREGGVLGAMDLFDLDALILPSTSSVYLPALGGLPIISVPLGRHPDGTEMVRDPKGHLVQIGPNVPFGVSFMGRAWSEENLIGFAYAFEQRTMVRRRVVPYVVPKTELKSKL